MNQKHFSICATAILVSSIVFAACAAPDKDTGWKMLFDGKTTTGWRSYNKKTFPDHGWVVEDGCLHLKPNSKAGSIITTEKYTDFDLEWDWRISPKANNGIKYLVTESRPNSPGHEYQMVDNSIPAGRAPNHETASFYEVLAPQVKPQVHPPGEWNHSRLLIQGNHVEHWLNGEKVLAYELGSPELKTAVAKSKFKDEAGFGEKISGHILLTDHNGEVWYRNVRLHELPPK